MVEGIAVPRVAGDTDAAPQSTARRVVRRNAGDRSEQAGTELLQIVLALQLGAQDRELVSPSRATTSVARAVAASLSANFTRIWSPMA